MVGMISGSDVFNWAGGFCLVLQKRERFSCFGVYRFGWSLSVCSWGIQSELCLWQGIYEWWHWTRDSWRTLFWTSKLWSIQWWQHRLTISIVSIGSSTSVLPKSCTIKLMQSYAHTAALHTYGATVHPSYTEEIREYLSQLWSGLSCRGIWHHKQHVSISTGTGIFRSILRRRTDSQ